MTATASHIKTGDHIIGDAGHPAGTMDCIVTSVDKTTFTHGGVMVTIGTLTMRDGIPRTRNYGADEKIILTNTRSRRITMDLEEALAWLNSERSAINYAYGADHGGKQVNAARMDASNMEQAYWVVRAHKEGLLDALTEESSDDVRALADAYRHFIVVSPPDRPYIFTREAETAFAKVLTTLEALIKEKT